MATQNVSHLLGTLQKDPENRDALTAIAQLTENGAAAQLDEEAVRLIDHARQSHDERAEYRAVAQLLELLSRVSADDPDRSASLLAELGRVYREELLDDQKARAAYHRALELRPGDAQIQGAIEQIEQTAENWDDFASRYIEEAETAIPALKSGLLVSAASLIWKYKKRGRDKQVDSLFKAALGSAEGDTRPTRLYEHILRTREKYSELATMLLEAAEQARTKEDRVSLLLRAGRVLRNDLDQKDRAAACYERILDFAPGHGEAMAFLVEHFTEREQWDQLVALYEDALRSRNKLEDEAGALLQLGMVHWRFRGAPNDAEPYFARLRKMDPAHPGMLDFYRDHLRGNDEARWVTILTDAQRVAASEEQKLQLAIELAKAAQAGGVAPERAIDAWKAVLRIDPTHPEAPEALKALYEKSEKWNALVELLKGEADRVPEGKPERKVALLRHLIPIYRDKLGLDVMVINTYNAIIQLDGSDREALEALAGTYESTGRWNDLIGVLSRKADASTDPEEKVALYMRVASLWIERFANYNQATDPLEKVVQIDPHHREALSLLTDIYKKKRAWKPLFDVLSKEAELASDPSVRLAHRVELARIAGERLHKHAEAIALWRSVLGEDPNNTEALDALEKLSEREKDWPTLAEVTERRVTEANDDKTKLKLLSKLGVIYGEHMQEVVKAASAWKRILDLDPKNGRALRTLRETFLASQDWEGLQALYAEANDWEGLVDVLGNAAERATDNALKIDLSFRAADIYQERLNQPHRAFRSYERILVVDPKNERAARALIPIYERDEKWNRLPALYEVLLPGGTEGQRLEILDRLRVLSLERLSDAAGAFGYAARAFQIAPNDESVRETLEDEAERSGKYEATMELYLSRLDTIAAGEQSPETDEESMRLRRRVAVIAGVQLAQPELAIEQLRAILESHPDDAESASTLEEIYRASNRSRDLRGLLLHRISHAPDDAQRLVHLHELARLEEEVLEDAAAAAARYRTILEQAPNDRAALAALDRLGVAGEQWEEVADMIRRQQALAETDDERNELTLRLGEILVTWLDDAPGALAAFGEVVQAKPDNLRAIAGLELVRETEPSLGDQAGLLLESAYEATGAWEKLGLLLEKRMKASTSPAEKRALRLRYADVTSRQATDTGGAYKALEEAFLDDPADEELQDRLIEAAEQANRHEELASALTTAIDAGSMRPPAAAALASKVATLYDVVLARPAEAEVFHKKVLAHDPADERSFISLKELYTNAERWGDLQGLYRERIAQTFEQEAKLDLLMQVCFLFEELIDDPEQAIKAYQDVLELDPEDQASRRALERLYERTERWRDLVTLLRGELDRANADEQVGLTQRLGVLHEKKLGEPEPAVDQYEQVLAVEPNHRHAREALERLIANPGQRQRIAKILEPIYEERQDWAELAQTLEVQLEEVEDAGTKVALLTRVAGIQEDRLHDPGAAFSSIARATLADPSDAVVREELARLARMRDSERERAKVLESAISASTENRSLVSELFLELAQLWDERVGDVDEAETAYKRLLESEPDDPEILLTASRALERIYLGKGDHAALADVLRRQVVLEDAPEDRRRLLVRLADLLEEVLEDKEGAIAAHRERLELDPSDVDAMRALERLYEKESAWPALIEILTMHDGVATDPDEQRTIAHRIGAIYENQLTDRDSAINAYSDALNRFGQDADTLEALSRLYEQAERWTDLLDISQMVYELAEEGSVRGAIRFQMAEIMRLRTNDLERAVEAYSEVLDLVPDHEGALGSLALVMIASAPAEEGVASEPYPLIVRAAAARVLLPRYEATADYEALLLALSVLAESDDPVERFRSLRRAAEVADAGLEDPSRAFALQGQAVRAGLTEDDLGVMLRDLSRLAEASGQWQDYVALLEEISPDIMDGELAVYALTRVADVAKNQLGDAPLARKYYERVLEQQPEDQDALDALEALTREGEDYPALLDVLRRKTELAETPEERVELLLVRAKINETRLEDTTAAIECYESALAEASKPREAYDGLERLYAKADRFHDLASHYERMLEDGVGEPVEIRYRLGMVQLDKLIDSWSATEQFRQALDLDNRHQPTIAALERLMQSEEHRATAAEILEPVFLQQMAWPKVTECLEARIAADSDVDERKAHLTRLGQIHEDYLEDLDGALDSYARLFREDPRDEGTWETLARLARVLEKPEKLALIYESALEDIASDDESTAKLALMTGQIHETKTGDLEAAGRLYLRALRFDRGDHGAFESLERVYQRREAWEQLLDLYREQSEVAEDDETRVALLRKSARLLEEQLAQPERAIETYRDILQIAPDDPNAIALLDDLLLAQQKWPDVADHLRHQIELAAGQPEENDLKFRLASVLEDKLNDTHAAIDVYEEITANDPHHADTVASLEALVQAPEHQLRIIQILEPIYLATDQWRKRIAIYEAQVALTEDGFDKVRLLAQIADLHETRSNDLQLAFHAQSRALSVEAENEEVRAEVDRLAAQLGTWDAHVHAYETALAATQDPATKTSLLATMARVHDEKRGDPRAAIETYERLLQIDGDDPSPLDSLEALHTMVGDWRGLSDVLTRKVQRAFDPAERGELLRRAGSVLEELLGDRAAAIEAYKNALGEDEADVIALESLDRLYASAQDHENLADTLRRRIELESDPATRVELSLRLGEVHEEHLRRPEDAIEAFQRVLDDEAEQPAAIEALARLYEKQQMWPDLLDNLRLQSASSSDQARRVQLLYRAGEVLEREMDDVPAALSTYEEVLALDTHFEPAVGALLRIGKLEDYRVQASDILEPLLRTQERWDELAEILSGKAQAAFDPVARKDELRRLAEVHEQGRRDVAGAFDAYRRALNEDPSDVETADDIERLAAVLGAWDKAADAFASRASSVLEPDVSRALYGRLARIAETQLNDDARAIEAYTRAIEQAGDDPETLEALDRLYTKNQAWQELGEILDRRVQSSTDDAERGELLVRVGTLKHEQFKDLRGAFRAFSEVLDRDPSEHRAISAMEALLEHDELAPEVVEVLEPVYRQTGATEKVAALFDVRIQLAETDGERVRFLQDQAAVYEGELGDPARALEALRRSFELDPRDENQLADLERLAPLADGWETLRGLVERVVESKGQSGDIDRMLARDLHMRAARWYREHLNDPAAAEARLRDAIAAEPETKEAHELLVELLRQTGRERELVAALTHWADVDFDEDEKKSRLREAASLAESALGDPALAAATLEKILEVDAGDAGALAELTRIEAARGDHDKVARLLLRRIDVEMDPAARVELRKDLARANTALDDTDSAIEAWRGALDEEPSDLESIEALEGLYEKADRWGDLEELIQRRLDIAETPKDRIAARVRLARLADQRLGRREEAMEQLRDILEEDPGNPEALDELERLYAADEKWEELVGLLEQRSKDALSNGDVDQELDILVRLAEVYRAKLKDGERATEIYQRVLDREPNHAGVLRALIELSKERKDWAAAVDSLEKLGALLSGEEAIETAFATAQLAETSLGDPARAEQALRRAYGLDPHATKAREALKAHYEKHKQPDRLAEMLVLDERDTEEPKAKVALLRRIADIHAKELGDPGQAAQFLERAAELVPEDREVLLPLCDFYIAAGRQRDAIPVLEQIIASYGARRNKEVAVYHHRLGKAKESMGDLDGAMESYDAAFKVDLTNVRVLSDLGRLCVARGDFDRAEKTFRALLLQKLRPDDEITKADVYFHLGEIAAKKGDAKKGISMLERALAEDKTHGPASALMAQLKG
jgi:tetratricopeptide (TPR) repeat protein